MKTTDRFKALVAQTVITARVPTHQAEVLTARAHPDLAILYRACGETPARVRFCNSRIDGHIPNNSLFALRKQFQADVAAEMQSTGCTYDVAFNRVAAKSALFGNSEDMDTIKTAASGTGGVPTLTPALAKLFRLPPDVSPEEWRIIWEENGNTATTINYGRCFSGACEAMQRQTGKDAEAVIEPTKQRFPDLWDATTQLAQLSF